MLKGKVAGVAIGGFAGFLILNRLIGSAEHCIVKMCEAAKWRAYYKNSKEMTVPPGYASTTRPIDDHNEIAVESPEQVKARENAQSGKNEKAEETGKAIADTLVGVVKDLVDNRLGKKKEEKEVECIRHCRECTVKDQCPYESIRCGGEITAWDEEGNPVGGRYSWNDEKNTQLKWCVDLSEKFRAQKDEEDDTDGDEIHAVPYDTDPEGEDKDNEDLD